MFTTPQAVANEVADIANQLEGAVVGSVTAAGASPQVQQQVTEGIDGLKKAAAALATADGAAQAQPIIQRILSDGNAVLSVVGMLPLPAPASTIIRLVEISLPMVAGLANIIFAAQPQAQPAAQQAAQGQQQQPQQQAQPGQPQAGQQPQQGQQTAQQPVQPSATPGRPSPQDLAEDKTAARSDMPRRGPGA